MFSPDVNWDAVDQGALPQGSDPVPADTAMAIFQPSGDLSGDVGVVDFDPALRAQPFVHLARVQIPHDRSPAQLPQRLGVAALFPLTGQRPGEDLFARRQGFRNQLEPTVAEDAAGGRQVVLKAGAGERVKAQVAVLSRLADIAVIDFEPPAWKGRQEIPDGA